MVKELGHKIPQNDQKCRLTTLLIMDNNYGNRFWNQDRCTFWNMHGDPCSQWPVIDFNLLSAQLFMEHQCILHRVRRPLCTFEWINTLVWMSPKSDSGCFSAWLETLFYQYVLLCLCGQLWPSFPLYLVQCSNWLSLWPVGGLVFRSVVWHFLRS